MTEEIGYGAWAHYKGTQLFLGEKVSSKDKDKVVKAYYREFKSMFDNWSDVWTIQLRNMKSGESTEFDKRAVML